jgi:hypothetical protein
MLFGPGITGALSTAPARGVGVVSRTAALRARHAATFGEYTHFRNQGFTAAQAHYLTKPYTGAGHHFPITQSLARRWNVPNAIRDSSLNVLRPRGISRGRFYELHYMVDPHWHYAAFPARIGGAWNGGRLGLQMYGPATRWWHATPGPLKITGGVGVVGSGAAGGYWLSGSGPNE